MVIPIIYMSIKFTFAVYKIFAAKSNGVEHLSKIAWGDYSKAVRRTKLNCHSVILRLE